MGAIGTSFVTSFVNICYIVWDRVQGSFSIPEGWGSSSSFGHYRYHAGFTCIHAAAAAVSLRSGPTLCNPIDGSPPGSAVPGILQARTLEWVAISFSIAWKWKGKVKSLSRVRPSATQWTAAFQAPPSMGFSRQEYWRGVPLPSTTSMSISTSMCNLISLASQVVLVVKNPPANTRDVRDVHSISGWGRSPGGGHGNPFQCSRPDTPMDRGAWRATVHRVAKSRTRLSDWALTQTSACSHTLHLLPTPPSYF